MRRILFLGVVLSGCADAPITPDQLQSDGTLRPLGHAQAEFSATPRPQQVQQAVQVSAVLAAQADGPLEDCNDFEADVGTIYLHVRADGLLQPRAVLYRWTHGDLVVLEPGSLAPTDALSLGTSFDIDPELHGHWEVEVLADAGSDPEKEGADAGSEPRVLFHREFEVKRPSD